MTTGTALVSGASRGVGRGIAVALGAAGWRVWVTGRSGREAGSSSHLPGTVEETAEAVTTAGGIGVPRVCDHRDPALVEALVHEISSTGPLDLLVNCAWAGYERLNAGAWAEWNAPFWEQPLELFDLMFDGGVRTHYLTSRAAAPALMKARGLIVTVSMEAGAADAPGYGVAYSASKAADDRLTESMARQLRDVGVGVVSVYPGLVRTEGVMQFADHLDLTDSQSPEGVGRTIAALAADDHLRDSGRGVYVTELAERYGLDITA